MPDLLFSHGVLCPGEVGLVPRAPTKCSAHSKDTAARLSPVPPPPQAGFPCHQGVCILSTDEEPRITLLASLHGSYSPSQ